MEVRCLLVSVGTVIGVAILSTSEPQESFSLNGIIFAVVVEMHLDIRGTDVGLVTT